jgi:hypothetical protein
LKHFNQNKCNETRLFYVLTLNSGYYLYGSLGGTIAGGIKINGRHSIEHHLTVNRIISDIADASDPISNFIYETGIAYLFTLFNVKHIFSAEMGLQINIAQDEMLSRRGYTGVTARLSIGKKRFAWFAQGILSGNFIADFIESHNRNPIDCATVMTGIRVLF